MGKEENKKRELPKRRLQVVCTRKVSARGRRGKIITPPRDFAVNVGDVVVWYRDLDTGDLIVRPAVSE